MKEGTLSRGLDLWSKGNRGNVPGASSPPELRASRDVAWSVIESIPLPLVVLDLRFEVCYANHAFCFLSGLDARRVEGRLFADVSTRLLRQPTQLRVELEALRKVRHAGAAFSIKQPGAGSRAFSIRGQVLAATGEEFLLLTFEDVTARNEAECELASTMLALEQIQEEMGSLNSNIFSSHENERRRIARELHDDVSQRLVSLHLESGSVEEMITLDSTVARAKLRQMRARIGRLAQDVTRLAHHLHPSIIEDLGLVVALRTIVEEIDRNEQVSVSFSAADVPEAIPVEAATALYRIAQEALRNAVKHAGRTQVKVQLRGMSGALELEVSDAGGGFNLGAGRAGLGLVSMEERARLVRGRLRIMSAPGQGTRVMARVPLQ